MKYYYKNLIFCGNIDYLCLVCQDGLYTTEDVNKHIELDTHKKKFEIRGVELKPHVVMISSNEYYCTLCNLLLETIREITVHVKDVSHIEALHYVMGSNMPKKDLTVKVWRGPDRVVIGDKLAISFDQWHGIDRIGEFCELCQDCFDTPEEHVMKMEHLKALISSPVQKLEIDELFRFVGMKKRKFHCFACNRFVSIDQIASHWETAGHYIAMSLHRESYKAFLREDTQPLENEAGQTTSRESTAQLREDISECVRDPQNLVKLMEFGRKYHIILTGTDQTGHCDVCQVQVQATLQSFSDHLVGDMHRNNLMERGYPPLLTKKPILDFIRSARYYAETQDVLINARYCFDRYSFACCVRNTDSNTIGCLFCRKTFLDSETASHCQQAYHRSCMYGTHVYLFGTDEVMRQVDRLLQCIYCNIIFTSWTEVNIHVTSAEHIQIKNMRNTRIRELRGVLGLTGGNTALDDLTYLQANTPESFI